MIKEIKTEKFEGLAVVVPDGFKGGIANMGYLIGKIDNPATMIHEKHFNSPIEIQKQLDRVNKLPEFVALPAIKLPDGDFKVLGIQTELTEEQCDEIIRSDEWPMFVVNQYYWPDFNHIDDQVVDSAKESFETLMEANDIYSENPYKFPSRSKKDSINQSQEDYDNYYGAAAYTGTWLILQKIIS